MYILYISNIIYIIGDPARIHSLVIRGELEMENIRTLGKERITELCQFYDIPVSGKSKVLL